MASSTKPESMAIASVRASAPIARAIAQAITISRSAEATKSVQKLRRRPNIVLEPTSGFPIHDAAEHEVPHFEIAAGEQHEGYDREDSEEQDRVQPLERRRGDQQRRQQDRAQGIDDIGPPALGDRIEAVDELTELRAHERPAGAGGVEAGVAALAFPDRVDEQEAHEGRQRQRKQRRADHGHGDVERAGEKMLAHEADEAPRRQRRRQRGHELAADEGAGNGVHRSTSAFLRLYQFISAEVMSEIVRYTPMVMAMISIAWPVWFSVVPAKT